MIFKIGQEVDWLHGEHVRIGTIVDIKDDKLKISGMDSEYWVSKTVMIRKLNRRADIPSIYDPPD